MDFPRFSGTIDLAGSKSFTNRSLILAAQVRGETILLNVSHSDDSRVLIEALRKLGVQIEGQGDIIKVSRSFEEFPAFKGEIDVGSAGTSMRFLAALCAAVPKGEIVLTGSERMCERPIGDLVNALREMGVTVDYLGKEGCPPIKIHGMLKQTARSVKIQAGTSSQFLSALLLAAPSLASYFEAHVDGPVVSSSYIDMTIFNLRQFGINAIKEGYRYFLIAQTEPQPGSYFIDGDASGACYFFALAAASGGTVRVNNLNIQGPQGDLKFLKILEKSGCRVESGDVTGINWISVAGSGKIIAVEEDLTLLPDSAQTLAVLCALAQGDSKITGLSTLRHKETDRIQALQNELEKIGIKTESGSDYLVVHGGTINIPNGGVDIETYEDHRMAMSFGILAKLFPQIRIRKPEVVSKSFPDFWEKLGSLKEG